MHRSGTDNLHAFILRRLPDHPADITSVVMKEYEISRQAVNRHLHDMADAGAIVGEGATRARTWKLAPAARQTQQLRMTPLITEDRLWSEYGRPAVTDASASIRAIVQFGFTAAVANVVDHASATKISVSVARDAASIEVAITDDGVGVFASLIHRFSFASAHQALFELVKGRLTTAPDTHAGSSLFLGVHLFDRFELQSGRDTFSYDGTSEMWSARAEAFTMRGTSVRMRIGIASKTELDDIVDWYTAGSGRTLERMHVPMALLAHEGDALLTRTQARRALHRIDTCREALLDFRNVDTIGPAFADEMFRVFRAEKPGTSLVTLHAAPVIRRRIHEAMAPEGAPV